MAEYYFENREDRTLKAYLRIGDSLESSFFLTFKRTDAEPRNVVKGSNRAAIDLICDFERIAKMSYVEIAKDASIEWIPIPVTDDSSKIDDKYFVYDPAISFIVKDYIQLLNLN